MTPGVEPSADYARAEPLPGMTRDEFLDPPAKEAFEPVLIPTETRTGRGDASRR
jgi:hypothetical protein